MKKIILVGLAIFASNSTSATQGVEYHETYRKMTNEAQNVQPLLGDIFGEKVDLFTGSTSFAATDIDLRGNNSLPVRLARKIQIEDRKDNGYIGGFADWDVDVPYIESIIDASGWKMAASGPNTYNRCSIQGSPYFPGSFFTGIEWNGISVYIPDTGQQKLLKSQTNSYSTPSDGIAYPWVTKDNVRIRCAPTTKNGYPGESFIAVTPNGVKYFFDWMVERKAPTLLGPPISEYGRAVTFRKRAFLLASRIEDRFGNWVNYTYSVDKLTQINSSDGRTITLTYNGSNIVSATANSRVWSYQYVDNNLVNDPGLSLSQVTLPDSSKWKYQKVGALVSSPSLDEDLLSVDTPDPQCLEKMPVYLPPFKLTVTHPSNALGEFNFISNRQYRTRVPWVCEWVLPPGMHYSFTGTMTNVLELNAPGIDRMRVPNYSDQLSLQSKKLSGPAVSLQTTTFEYGYADGFSFCGYGGDPGCMEAPASPDTPLGSKWVTVTNPDNTKNKYLFGVQYDINEGRLLEMQTLTSTGAISSRQSHEYVTDQQVTTMPFSAKIGQTIENFKPLDDVVRPKRKSEIVQDGVTFTSTVTAFDTFARPATTTKSSSLGYSRIDTVKYENNLNKWVMDQPTIITNTDTGNELSKTVYDPTTALPIQKYSFGQLDTTFTYFADGNLNTAKDALNRTITLSDYYRGVPRSIVFPDATSISATVNANGTIASTTDQLGSVTQYSYDLMDRIAGITPPTGDSVAWTGATQTFAMNTVAAYGLPVGHWKQTISKGNYRKEVYFNAQWQPVVTREYDNSNIAGTQRFTRMEYDVLGRNIFASYPGTTDALTLGVRTEYDALGRVTKTKQDSELLPNLGVLNTTTEYLTGFQTRVTNPRGFATTTSYQVFDTPDTSRPEIIVSPEGMTTTILRNVYGNPLSVTRSGTWNNAAISSARSYVYDTQQRLCKRIEPETGATLMDYDAVGNLAWSVQGRVLTSNTCDRASVAALDKTIRTYNTMNRLVTTDVPGTTDDLSYVYFADGALQTLFNGSNRWDYTYNKLRLPVTEQLTIDGRIKTLTHAYNSMAQESSLTYPSGLVVATTPNALGQASQAGTFATGVNYHPMGGMSIFNYGNGIVHSMTPNTRMLPTLSKDMNGTIAILHDTYAFDANGNVASITDGTLGAGGNRTMSYDNADRLIQTNAPNLAWMSNTFSYDALDNIRTNTLGGRAHTYQYNATTKRLDQLTLPNATVARNLAYDAQGNVTTNGAQSYVFDKANRMQSVNGIESYQYDGHGRRVKTVRNSDGKISYPIYSLEGKLVTDDDQRSNKTIDYVYLNGSLVAKRSAAIGSTTYITSYQHTDSLGSPVAESDAAKTVTFIKRYTPYGEPSDQNYVQGPGFTGHVTDAATGLTYAQQRYYDPMLGKFLSADPMTSDLKNGWNFNRYSYANNNPYKFTDPDGRCSGTLCDQYTRSSKLCEATCISANAKTFREKLGRNLGRLGDSVKVEGAVGFTLGVKAKIGPAKVTLEAGALKPFGVGATLSDVYSFTEIRKPSGGIELGNYGLGWLGKSEKSLLGRNGKLYSEEKSEGGLMVGRKNWQADTNNGEVGVQAGVLFLEVNATIDLGKAAIAIFYWGNSEVEP